MGRLLLAAALLLLGLVAGGLWALPGLLDWNRYRDSIASLVAAGLGRPVRIEGDVTLHLLPQPVLTAAGVEVEDVGDGISLRVGELRMRVALGPLLAGRVQARELALRGPELRLPWPPAPGAPVQRPSAWLTGQARIEGGWLVVGGLTLTGIDATLSTDADTGTLSAAGTGSFAERAWRFTARLARPGRDGAAGLEWSLDGQGPLRDTGGSFSGQIASRGALTGRVAGRGPDLSQLMPGPAVPWRADGRLSAAGGLAVADELAVEIGGSPGRGTVALRVGEGARLDLALAAGRLDLDAWLPALLRAQRPAALPTGLDLSAEAASLAGGTLRRLRGAFDLGEDGVEVREAAAVLPGEARLTLAGRIPPGDKPGFEGTGRLAAPDLRATLRWLERLAPGLLSAPPEGVLRTADLQARAAAAPGQLSLSDLRGRLDGEALTGGLSVKLGPRPSFAAGLAFERLALDPWLPDPAPLARPGAAAEMARRFGGFDADLSLQARRASWRGVPVERLALDAQTEAARLTLRRLEATALGARLSASGTVGEGGRVTEAAAELTSPDVAPLRAVAPPYLVGLLEGPGTARLTLSGPPDALAARLGVEVGDLRLDAQPTLDLPARRWAGPVTLRHPGAPRLLKTLGLVDAGASAWLGDGSLSLVAQLSAVPGRAVLEGLSLAAGAARLGGQLALERDRVTGRIAAEALPLPAPALRSGEPLPFWALRGWAASVRVEAAQVLAGLRPVLRRAAADVALEGGTLRVDRLTAALGGGALAGGVVLDAGADPPRASVEASLAGVAAAGPVLGGPLDLAAGVLDARFALAAAGHSPAALLATLSGTARIGARDGVVLGFDLSGAGAALDADRGKLGAELRAALAGGASPFARLDLPVELRRGTAAFGEAALTGPAGDASLSGTADLPGGTVDLRVALRPRGAEGAPELAVRLTGPAAEPRRTPELAALLRWLATRSP